MVVIQVALSLILLIGAGLCVQALRNARTIDTGFDTGRVLTATFDLNRQNYKEPQGRMMQRQLLERVRAVPGVESASLGVTIPLSGSNWSTRVTAEDAQGRFPDERRMQTTFNLMTAPHLPTLGIPILFGRNFTPQEEAMARPVAVLGEAAARKLWPEENPIGRHVKFGWNGKDFLVEVVGVARETKGASLFGNQRPHIYFSLGMVYEGATVLFVRTKNDPASLAAALPGIVQPLDPGLPVYDIKPLAAYFETQIGAQRLAAWLISAFGMLALGLAGMGLYGVLAFAVAQRTVEIGIRMALGAQRRQVLQLVVGQGMRLVIAGLAIGLAGAWGLTRFLRSLLIGISPLNAAVFFAMTLLLIAASLLACLLPARRAARVDPMTALREE